MEKENNKSFQETSENPKCSSNSDNSCKPITHNIIIESSGLPDLNPYRMKDLIGTYSDLVITDSNENEGEFIVERNYDDKINHRAFIKFINRPQAIKLTAEYGILKTYPVIQDDYDPLTILAEYLSDKDKSIPTTVIYPNKHSVEKLSFDNSYACKILESTSRLDIRVSGDTASSWINYTTCKNTIEYAIKQIFVGTSRLYN